MKMSRQKPTNRWIITAVVTLVLIFLTQKENLAQEIEVTHVDDSTTGYATFLSHNQKVVSNKNGIFMVHTRTEEGTGRGLNPAQWRLSRSTDGGKTFSTIYEAKHATRPPSLETDADNNIYLMLFDYDRNPLYTLYFYRFLAKDNYQNPIITNAKAGRAFGEATQRGKKTMIYDRARKQFYVWGPGLYIIKLDGTIRFSEMLVINSNGHNSNSVFFTYPYFSLGDDGVLYAAMTTEASGYRAYRDIRAMKSPDGGNTWQSLTGTPLSVPIKSNHPNFTRITLNDEDSPSTWLASMMVKDGKIHFAYEAIGKRRHYMRYDAKTGVREIDNQKNFNVFPLDGFFTTRSTNTNAPLYFIGRSGSGVGALVSYDNGTTWQDYANITFGFRNLQYVGGFRSIGEDGYIVGSFTQATSPAPVYFFRIKADFLTTDTRAPNPPLGLQVAIE